MSLFETEIGPRGVAVVKYRRDPRPEGRGIPADLPGAVGAYLVLSGGVLGDAQFRASNGTVHVRRGEIRGASPYETWRALRWDPAHPRDAAVLKALRGLSGPWEVGWRAAVA